jgi:Zn-dependent peptidase ImmA (M78 family)
MNTTKKGDKFEKEILNLLKREIAQGNFFAPPERCEVFAKKGYYSRDRKKDIIFDISVEISLPNQETYSILVLIECKNYNHPIPVDDVEEFHSKIQQVSGANVKGIFASSNSFQESAINFSQSKGIGLLRYYSSDNFKWELTRSPSALASYQDAWSTYRIAYSGITTEPYISRYFDCYCCSTGQYTNSLRAFFFHLLLKDLDEETKSHLEKAIVKAQDNASLVEYRTKTEIEAISLTALSEIAYRNGEVSLNSICDWQFRKNQLKLIVDSTAKERSNSSVLGKITFDPLKITIYRGVDHRYDRERFTLAHEIGHHLLGHRRYMTGEYVEEADLDLENPVQIGIKDIVRMEWQANYFAACLLMPKVQFVADVLSVAKSLGLKDRGYGVIYLDRQSCNLNDYLKVTSMVKGKYKVSGTAMRIRLKELGLLNDTFDAED